MAVLTCRYFSDVLGQSTTATVILPQQTQAQIGSAGVRHSERVPVLYLLHGMTDDDSIWTRRTSIERYVEGRNLAVVMPAAHRSFYTDQADGYAYWTHIAEEVPEVMSTFFPLSSRREDTFVAGLSMGGYGALKLALRHPRRFAGAVSLSGALNVTERPDLNPAEWRRTFGDGGRSRDRQDDLLDLAQTVDPNDLPALYVWCGVDDWLLPDSRAFHAISVQRGLPVTYKESAGDHDWTSWDREIARALDWLPSHDRQPGPR